MPKSLQLYVGQQNGEFYAVIFSGLKLIESNCFQFMSRYFVMTSHALMINYLAICLNLITLGSLETLLLVIE